jgi:hypothetical protein
VTASQPLIQLPAADVAELIELLQFIDDWLATCPPAARTGKLASRVTGRSWKIGV